MCVTLSIHYHPDVYNLVSGTTSSSQSFDCMGGSCEEMYKKETKRTFAKAEMGDYATCTYFLVPAIHENQFHVSLHLEGLLSREGLHLQYACHGPGNGQRSQPHFTLKCSP